MVLPNPVWSNDDIKVAEEEIRNPSGLITNTWSKDPAKLAVLRAIASCQDRLGHNSWFDGDITYALAQKYVCFLYSHSFGSGGSVSLKSF